MQTVVLWILKGLFLPLSIVHVYSCFADRMALRRGTKPFLLLTLAAIYLLGARVFHPLVFAALLCGFAGDTLLIFSDGNRRFFFFGAAAFAAGHVLYLAALFNLVSLRHNALLLLVLFLVFLAEPTFLFFRLRREIGGVLMRAVGGVYAAVIAAMAACSAYTLLLSPGIASTLRFCGMLSFLVSDSLLVFCTFRQNGEKPWQAGVVMSSYIAAQTLLCIGFSL